MSKWYYEMNKGCQETTKFEEILMETKKYGSRSLDIFMEMLEKAREMQEAFDKEFNGNSREFLINSLNHCRLGNKREKKSTEDQEKMELPTCETHRRSRNLANRRKITRANLLQNRQS